MKTKYIILLIGALIVGIIIGSLATGRVTRNKIERIKSFNTKEGFREHFFKIIEATEEQQKQLTPILDSFGERQKEMMKKHWEMQKLMFDEMDSLINPLLSPEQQQLRKEFKQKMRKDRLLKAKDCKNDSMSDNEKNDRVHKH